jgi:hypothetical protein
MLVFSFSLLVQNESMICGDNFKLCELFPFKMRFAFMYFQRKQGFSSIFSAIVVIFGPHK